MASSESPQHGSVPPRPSRFSIVALVVLAGGAFLAGSWKQELWSSREGRVASCAQAMLDTGDWLEPNLGDEFRAKKPPLAYWLAAVAGLTFGEVTDLAAKLPSVLAALGTVLVVFALGIKIFGSRRAGFFSALGLATTVLFWDEAHTASADMLMTFFIALAVLGFWRVLEEGREGQLDRALPWLALGLGFLAKGPVALAVPLVAVLGYLALGRRWREMARLRPSLLGLFLFLLLALPWYVAIIARHSDALGIWMRESFGRMSPTNTSHSEPNPFYYLMGNFWGAAAPWVVLLPALVIAAVRKKKEGGLPKGLLLAFAWGGLGLALFSISFSKRTYYLLPVMPGFALAFGWLLAEFAENRLPRAAGLAVRVPLGLLGAALAMAPFAAALDPRVARNWPAGLVFGVVPLACFALIGALLVAMSLARAARRWPLAESALVSTAALLIWSGLAVMPVFNSRKSLKAFCAASVARAAPGEEIASVRASKFSCLVHYLGRGRVSAWEVARFRGHVKGRPRDSGGLAIAELKKLNDWRAEWLDAEVLYRQVGRRKNRLALFRWRGGGKKKGD